MRLTRFFTNERLATLAVVLAACAGALLGIAATLVVVS